MNDNKRIAIMICTDSIGTDEPGLGKTLMRSYIYSVAEADIKPSVIMFLNKGVNLTTTGSPVLDSLKQLEEEGVEIISCGACLDFYKLKEALEVGTIGNMYTNVENMHEADNTIVIT